mgnify:CR=1 FL=1
MDDGVDYDYELNQERGFQVGNPSLADLMTDEEYELLMSESWVLRLIDEGNKADFLAMREEEVLQPNH